MIPYELLLHVVDRLLICSIPKNSLWGVSLRSNTSQVGNAQSNFQKVMFESEEYGGKPHVASQNHNILIFVIWDYDLSITL